MDNYSHRRKIGVALLSVCSNTFLVISKLIVGFLIGSVSVISEAIHSGVDLIASLIAVYAVRISGKPADEEHPFGHGKAENISGTIEAILIFLAAGWIIFEAVKKFISGAQVENAPIGILVMLISSIINLVVSSMLFKVGKETNSYALIADAWHLRTDVYTSAGVMLGLILIWAGEVVFRGFHFHWIDPLAAIVVALLIIKAAYNLTVQAGRDLMDARIPKDEEQWIRNHVAGFQPVVRAFHELRTRKSGNTRFIEFHLLVKGDMSVEESHHLTDIIAADIEKQFPDSSVTIHIEPCDGDCKSKCEQDCLLSEDERIRISKEIRRNNSDEI